MPDTVSKGNFREAELFLLKSHPTANPAHPLRNSADLPTRPPAEMLVGGRGAGRGLRGQGNRRNQTIGEKRGRDREDQSDSEQ
jgi:hypothetical protein